MIVLGIDPGIERCGWCVVEDLNSKMRAISYDCIFTDKEDGVSKRLEKIFDYIMFLTKKYQPDILAMEDLFFNTNAKTAILVGQARGVVLLAGAKSSTPVVSYTPLKIKMATTGFGRAEKDQVQRMVKNILHLDTIPKPDDTADALAVALTHCFLYKYNERTNNLISNT